jgi:serine/threonine protein phosphatase PrpC
MSALFFATAAKSAVGLVRAGNEDSALTSKHLIAVADGMGGHAGGEVASMIAITTLANRVDSFTTLDTADAQELFSQAIAEIDKTLAWTSTERPELSGLGTTLSSLLLHGKTISMGHIGDSRIYRLRGNTLEQISKDHSVIQELLDTGSITEEEIASHPQRSMLTHVLMGDGRSLMPLQQVDVKPNDRFILCSDGLSNVVNEKEIKSIVKDRARGAAVDALVEAAYAHGAPDNVTVIVADVLENDIQEKLVKFGAAQ